MADFVVSTTDPDATVMHTKGEGRHLGYHTHYVVDGGKARIIMSVLVTPSEVMENQPMLDLVFRTRFRWKLWPRQATGDTTYGTVDNIVALEHEHIRAYVPLPDFDQRTPFYGQRDFQYDPEQDAYTCPNGALLRLETHRYTDRTKEYRADAATCNACPLKEHCTDSEHGRSLRRSFDEEYLERVRAYHTTLPYQKAMRKRSVWVEPLFAEGKDWHGMRRFRLRRLWRVNCEALMRAAGQNLKRLLKKWGWGRRPWPEEAVCAVSHPDREVEEQPREDAPGRKWTRTLVASMISLGSTWGLRHVEIATFALAVGAFVGAPCSAEAYSLAFLLSCFASLNRVVGESWARMTDGIGTSTLCGISSTKEFFNRLRLLYKASRISNGFTCSPVGSTSF
jgi:hypothetical protein